MFVDAAVYLGVEGRFSFPIRRITHLTSFPSAPSLAETYSKIEFDSYLKEAGIGGAHDPPKRKAADVPTDGGGSVKLRMVGEIKCLHPELE